MNARATLVGSSASAGLVFEGVGEVAVGFGGRGRSGAAIERERCDAINGAGGGVFFGAGGSAAADWSGAARGGGGAMLKVTSIEFNSQVAAVREPTLRAESATR